MEEGGGWGQPFREADPPEIQTLRITTVLPGGVFSEEGADGAEAPWWTGQAGHSPLGEWESLYPGRLLASDCLSVCVLPWSSPVGKLVRLLIRVLELGKLGGPTVKAPTLSVVIVQNPPAQPQQEV